jgi:hypothetical protein
MLDSSTNPKGPRAMTAPRATRACRACGCTDGNACVTGGIPCHWATLGLDPRAGGDLCSACLDTQLDAVERKARAEAWRWSGVGFAQAPD